MTTKPRATIEDLYEVPGDQKAELVRGEVVLLSPTGDLPNRASLAISVRLKDYERADYFAAGTRVVWDVDVLREGLVRVYRATEPENPGVYRRKEVAEAEPALPGFRMAVDELFD